MNKIANYWILSLNALKISILVDESLNKLSTTVLELVQYFVGYIRYSCNLYGFRSNSGLRNMLGIEKLISLS